MEQVQEFLARFTTLFRSAAVLTGAVIGLGVLQRILNRGAGSAPDLRFRNQLVMSISGLFMTLFVIVALPIGDAMRGQLLSLFGIVVSATIALSAPSLLSNAMAGIMLKIVRNFRSGDFITVGEHFGRVSARGLFHTEIQLPDRDLTTLPNLMLATSPVTVIRSSGTVVSATCSIGYDVHHTRIESLLHAAVMESGLEEPFVQVVELGDFSVTYKAAGILREVKSLLATRSRLRVNMLDALHGDGVEIVSPDFRNVRDYGTDRTFIPVAPRRPGAPTPESVPVDVVFDKAESAESAERLVERRHEIEGRLKVAREEERAAEDDAARTRHQREIAALERQIASLEARLRARRSDDDGSD